MKVLLANPPAYIKDLNRHFTQAGSRWSFANSNSPKNSRGDHYHPYPFFLGYSSALLKRDIPEAETKAVDACALEFDEREFLSCIKEYAPDLLVIEIPTISFSLMMDILREIRELTSCAIAVAGSHVTALVNEVMEKNKFISYCLLGEYEITLKELVSTLISNGGKNLNEIDGLAFRSKGKILRKKRGLLRDLDYLPFPDRDDLPIEKYRNFAIAGKPCLQMWSSRGCPFNCSFCIHRQVMYASPLSRKRNPRKVVDEMKTCKEKHGAKQIFFDDDTMTASRDHVSAICREILERKLDLPWGCMGDINLDLGTLQLMKKAGCVGLTFGIETINAGTLKDIGKNFVGVEKAKQFVERCRKLGLYTHPTYMVGFPTDTRNGVLMTMKFARALDTDGFQVSIATPFPGTPFYDLCDKNGWLVTNDWTMYNGSECSVVNYPHLSKMEIEELFKLFKTTLKKGWEKRVFRWYLKHPGMTLRRVRNDGVSCSMTKSLKILKSMVGKRER